MRKLVAVSVVVLFCGCRPGTQTTYSFAFSLEVYNPIEITQRNIVIRLPEEVMDEVYPTFNQLDATAVRVIDREAEIASEYINKTFTVLIDSVTGREKRKLSVYYHQGEPPDHYYTKRSQSKLLNEGPAWESDKVGYRIHFDQQSTVGVLGKKTSELVLMGFGNEAMDIMKSSFVRPEVSDSVEYRVEDGPFFSSVEFSNATLGTAFSIHSGTRWTECIAYLNEGSRPMSTGIVKNERAKLFKSPGNDSTYAYIATYGRQSLNGDKLGLVVAFDPKSVVNFYEDENSYIVELNKHPALDWAEYYFAAAWEQELNGITNEADFIKFVERSARELANPVRFKITGPNEKNL